MAQSSSLHNLEQLLEFTRFNHSFRGVKRQVFSVGTKQFENDAEHSYQLALTAWYLVNTLQLALDINKVLRYSLAHDLIEVYAGDTPAFSKDAAHKNSKVVREAAAMARIYDEFSGFSQLHEAIECYERQVDDEARFVYALDKLLPVINGYLDDGASWKKSSLTLKQVIAEKDFKIKVSDPVYRLWQEVETLLKANEGKLFKQSA